MTSFLLRGWLVHFVASVAALAAAVTSWSQVTNNPPSIEETLPGTTRQTVRRLDRQGLKVVLNDRMNGVKIEGWSTTALTQAQTDALLDRFGVRTVWDPKLAEAHYYVPSNVGRAGILEGDTYFKLGGKIYKGLTLKGYGGNNNAYAQYMGEQPAGSLDFAEAIRDMEVSTVLAEGRVDTYLGVVAVERPGGKANYVRISRTALRMEDLIRFQGQDLAKVADYLSDLLSEELGRKLSRGEFARWLTQSSADVMARKDYIRFTHASITDSNLGIGELVDLGDPYILGSQNTQPAGLRLPGEYESQNARFKAIAKKVHDNLTTIEPSLNNVSFDSLYDDAYEARLKQLSDFDRAQVNLSRATEAQLVKIGFTQAEAVEIVKYNMGTREGIVDPVEVKQLKAITRDIDAILDRTTTDFMRLSDGTNLQRYYVRNVGGAEGVRALLEETRDFVRKNNLDIATDYAKVETEIRRLAIERARKLGYTRAVTADVVTNMSRFIARQALTVITK